MRIIGGKFKNRLIKTPKGESTRPTSSLVRGAIFNMCQPLIEDALFLDLFAGSGAMGLEALSRGAKHVIFVEKDPKALLSIKANIQLLGVSEQCQIIPKDAFLALKILEKKGERFTIISADPPYITKAVNFSNKLIHLLDETSLLEPQGILFIEEGQPLKVEKPFTHFSLKEIRQYGNTYLHVFHSW